MTSTRWNSSKLVGPLRNELGELAVQEITVLLHQVGGLSPLGTSLLIDDLLVSRAQTGQCGFDPADDELCKLGGLLGFGRIRRGNEIKLCFGRMRSGADGGCRPFSVAE